MTVSEISEAVEVGLGGLSVGDAFAFGRSWQVTVESGPHSGTAAEDIRRLKVRNSSGKMIPLSKLVTVRETKAPAVIERLDMYPLVEITANPAAGVSRDRSGALCGRPSKSERCGEIQLSV